MRHPRPARIAWLFVALGTALWAKTPPSQDRTIAVDDLRPGMKGEVWTVFQGTEPEPFDVEIVGVAKQGLGPGRSMIIAKITDPRVQRSGAAAGMSGSPLYVDGKWAGALSYQVQRFETVRHAGFTPAADMLEVARAPAREQTPRIQNSDTTGDGPRPLGLAFSFAGVAPEVLAVFRDRYAALGIDVGLAPLGGSTGAAAEGPPQTIRPGSPIGVALAHGDLSLGGTGTVTHVNGSEVYAFGHPMMGMGPTEVPLAEAEIITILPSLQTSFKLANMGRIIGTLRQDRLSAIYGELGPAPAMVPITVRTPERTLRFQAAKEGRLIPLLAATGLMQAVNASNAQGGAEGYLVRSVFHYADQTALRWENWYEGGAGLQAGALELVARLGLPWQSPLRGLFPARIEIDVERLGSSPLATLDLVQTSAPSISVGESLQVTLQIRTVGNVTEEATVEARAESSWMGRRLELAVLNGPALERLTDHLEGVSTSQLRDADAFRDWLRQSYRDDGLYVVVLDRTTAVWDEATAMSDTPGSFERIARRADEARFPKREILLPLSVHHVFPGRLLEANVRRPLQITD